MAEPVPVPAAVETMRARLVNMDAMGRWDIQRSKVRSMKAFSGADTCMQ